jgi:hypothetical protein
MLGLSFIDSHLKKDSPRGRRPHLSPAADGRVNLSGAPQNGPNGGAMKLAKK